MSQINVMGEVGPTPGDGEGSVEEDQPRGEQVPPAEGGVEEEMAPPAAAAAASEEAEKSSKKETSSSLKRRRSSVEVEKEFVPN